jgi:hypothetical protein
LSRRYDKLKLIGHQTDPFTLPAGFTVLLSTYLYNEIVASRSPLMAQAGRLPGILVACFLKPK